MDFMLLFGFTITEGVLVGVICSNYTLMSVLAAVLVIGILVPCMALYTGTTKTDVTGMGGYQLQSWSLQRCALCALPPRVHRCHSHDGVRARLRFFVYGDSRGAVEQGAVHGCSRTCLRGATSVVVAQALTVPR